jgi:hypothetical protein
MVAVVAWVRNIRSRRLAVAAVATFAAAAVASAAALETAQSAEVTDPAGDMLKNNAEPWQDIVRGRIVREGDTFTFSMEMAAPLPADPPVPGGGGWYFWDWGINSDSDLAPAGFPFPKQHAAPHEFLVLLVSDGEEYFAFVVDRRPLTVGQEAVVTPVSCSVDGATIEVFVDADLLDNLTEFEWRIGSQVLNGSLESEGHHRIENVPNDLVWLQWPQN